MKDRFHLMLEFRQPLLVTLGLFRCRIEANTTLVTKDDNKVTDQESLVGESYWSFITEQ